MSSRNEYMDLSSGIVSTSSTKTNLAAVNAKRAADLVYREFSSDHPIRGHLIEFVAHRLGRASAANFSLTALKNYDYLSRENLDEESIRMKGIVALNMIVVETYDDTVSAYLVEPFENVIILPQLYESWISRSRKRSAS